jgi:hypothetical protein
MTIQERVQELFHKFNVNLTVEQTRTELAEATLENGTVIYTDGDDFVEDGEAYIINDEGERIPLPPGDYTLADGGVISIGDIGKINKVQKPVSDGKGEGKGADGKPANVPNIDVTKPAKKKDKGDGGGDGGGKPSKKGKKKLSSDEEQTTDMKVELNAELVFAMLQERFPDLGEEVAQAIAVAVEEIYAQPEAEVEAEEEDEEMGYKDKEEMQVNPEAPKAEKEVEVEVEVEAEPEAEEAKEELSAIEEKSEIDLLKEALAQTNERLDQLHKMSAHGGLKHKAPSAPKAEPLDLANMTIEERVRALANQFSK